MNAPFNDDEPTGNPKRLAALVLLLLIIGSTLLYGSRQPLEQLKATIAASTADSQQTTIPPPAVGIDNEIVSPEDTQPSTTPAGDVPSTRYKITKTVDGDTIKADISGKIETIRLIGVDTPETKDPRKKVQCFGQAASDYTNVSLVGKDVRLVADHSQDNRDKYGRLLRYVFLDESTNFNEQLIAEGYAYEYTYDVPYEYQAEFKAALTTASAQGKGLWSTTTCNGKR